jgi:hypothetical protein
MGPVPGDFRGLGTDAANGGGFWRTVQGKQVLNAGGALYTILGVAPGDPFEMSHGCKHSPCLCWGHLFREEKGANGKRNFCDLSSCDSFCRAAPCLAAGPCANTIPHEDTFARLQQQAQTKIVHARVVGNRGQVLHAAVAQGGNQRFGNAAQAKTAHAKQLTVSHDALEGLGCGGINLVHTGLP